MLCGPVERTSTGREHTRVPTVSARVVSGPCSTISAQNSWPMAGLFEQGALEAIAIEGGPGAASALKMAYAAYTKGTSALLMKTKAVFPGRSSSSLRSPRRHRGSAWGRRS